MMAYYSEVFIGDYHLWSRKKWSSPPTGRAFPGTQWRAECEPRKFHFYLCPSAHWASQPIGPLKPAYKAGLAGHLPAKIRWQS